MVSVTECKQLTVVKYWHVVVLRVVTASLFLTR